MAKSSNLYIGMDVHRASIDSAACRDRSGGMMVRRQRLRVLYLAEVRATTGRHELPISNDFGFHEDSGRRTSVLNSVRATLGVHLRMRSLALA